MSAGRRLCVLLGAPLWLPLLVSLVAVLFSVCIALWASLVALICVALSGVTVSVASAAEGMLLPCFAAVGIACLCLGSAILLFCGSRLATRGSLALTEGIFRSVLGYFS